MGIQYLAAKIYRPRMFRSLRNDALYRFSRVQRDEQGQAEHGNSRRGSAATRKSERARAAQVASWIEYEYQTQHLLYTHSADVPRPFAQVGNAILMEYIGAIDEPAPRLSEVELPQEEAQPLFDRLMRNIELALIHGRIHGDLSAYNVLYWQGAVILIDFAQAVDPYHHSDVFSLFARDIERTCRYFTSYGINNSPWELARQIWTDHMGPVPELGSSEDPRTARIASIWKPPGNCQHTWLFRHLGDKVCNNKIERRSVWLTRVPLAFCHSRSYTIGASSQQYATRSSHGMPPI